MRKIALLLVIYCSFLALCRAQAQEEKPISLYVVYNGYDPEGISEIYHNNSFDLHSVKYPVFAGVIVLREDYNLECFGVDEFSAPSLRTECEEINERNGVIEYVEPKMGVVMMRGVSKKNPRFIDRLRFDLKYSSGFDVVRITYGEPPDFSWRPLLENVQTYVPLKERVENLNK